MNTETDISTQILKIELELKRLEILSKQQELQQPRRRWKLTVETATIIVALIAFLGSFLGTFLQGLLAKKQQRKEFESTVIINAIETASSETSKKNLQFLLDVGLISEKEWKINLKRIISDTTYRITYELSDNEIAFICQNPNAFAFHANKSCLALGSCTDTILSTSVFDAKYRHDRRPCKICY